MGCLPGFRVYGGETSTNTCIMVIIMYFIVLRKPSTALQGFLLPLCAEGNCTLREAVIVSAVLRRVSLPMLHSAAALLRIADMEYSGTNSFFIQVLLNKKYALPYRVVRSFAKP